MFLLDFDFKNVKRRYFPIGFADGTPLFEVAKGDWEGFRGGFPNGARAKHSLATIKQGRRFNDASQSVAGGACPVPYGASIPSGEMDISPPPLKEKSRRSRVEIKKGCPALEMDKRKTA